MNYKELDVYKVSIKIAEDMMEISLLLENKKQYILKDQMLRSSISIPSNIAEGFGRFYNKEKIRFLLIARGSAYELDTQVELMKTCIDVSICNEFALKITSVIKLINGMIKFLRKESNNK